MGDHVDARAAHALVAFARERADVLGHVDRVGADLFSKSRQLALGSAAADHQPRTALAQLAVQI